jgi:uridine kinase
MSYTDNNLVETYSGLLAGMSNTGKQALIERLSAAINTEKTAIDDRFYASYGAFASEKSAEEIIAELKASRTFSHKEIKF